MFHCNMPPVAKGKKSGKSSRALNILYRDAMIAAVEKPAGLAVQGGEGVSVSLAEILSAQLGLKVFPVHRLDKDTAGILVAALSRESAAIYSEYFRKKRIEKEYRAICIGAPPCMAGRISIPLSRRKGKAGKPAQGAETLYSVERIAAGGQFSLLSIKIETGRNHQIRRHLALEGFPVAGDDKYGDFIRNREIRKLYGARRLQLAATSIALPILCEGAKSFRLSCPLPSHMREFAALVFEGQEL